MSYRRTTPMPGGRRERRARRGTRNRVLTQVGIGLATASFAVGSIAAAAVPALTADAPLTVSADVASLPEIQSDAEAGAVVTTETEESTVEPKTVKSEDPNLAKGTEKVVTEGVAGQTITTYDVTTVGGVEVSRVQSMTVTVSEAQDEVIAVGTKEAPSVPRSTAAANPTGNRALGQQMAADMYGWTGDQWYCLEALFTKESGWNQYADNPYSSAYGIPQALPGSKMSTAGADWATNPATQIRWGLGYIAGRYGTPCGAWNHSQTKGWY
ncbi:G5 domain-containing protein [Demequina lignilytica]|uniref:G5 domain-containing protein n=1 Tax=Demequina lignilytica TaxID=3051663 RepID=A0AAW7M9K9_9MICO|nr:MULTISPECIES: G5 domain-containing protein [unclassified Demequina]MDN4477573.1 G5 domain-containing protein [Demequina sp. SYSU T00039-1]MDN4483617.1 G5 domain-containing protein [Demequina sp. SYSU T0a273]MDN4488076.1 G5 domain-containing protein [Demequina sp. SYSU T00039]MDN4490517.1 G5 domain-containing protein [Demequina sp. SYSU T00068]